MKIVFEIEKFLRNSVFFYFFCDVGKEMILNWNILGVFNLWFFLVKGSYGFSLV